MKLSTPYFLGLVAAAAIAAGCSGGISPGIPSASTPSNGGLSAISAPASLSGDAKLCGPRRGCPAHLIVPLALSSGHFTIGKYGSCKSVSLKDAKPYTTARTHRVALSKNVSLKPSCIPSSASARLFIAVAELGTTHHAAGAIDVATGGTKLSFVPLGNLVNTSGKWWTFSPVGLGTALKAHTKYVFYIISAPLATAAPTSNFLLLQPLNYDGTNFSVVPNTCFQGDPEDAPPYAATSTGPLTLSAPVSVTPTCVPSPLPSNLPQLYIVAVDLGSGSSSSGDHKHLTPAQRKQAFSSLPMDGFNFGDQAVAIAGPVNVTDNPWSFAPVSPGLTMTSGNNYAFFIAAALPPPPPPTQSFAEVVPLSFDGTSFTVPSIASCSSLPTAAPYTAPTSGPLTFTAPVSVTPTCPPASSSSSSSSSSSGQLYIVAAVICSNGGDGSSSSSSSSNSGNCCASSSSSSSSSCGSGNGSGNYKRSHDGSGSCQSGIPGGGDDALHLRPSDSGGGGYGGACTIFGYAIAGPVSPGSNPWSFAPLTPALNLLSGSQYKFYVGISYGGDGWGGGGGD